MSRHPEYIPEEGKPIENLANAIVVTAADDYRDAWRRWHLMGWRTARRYFPEDVVERMVEDRSWTGLPNADRFFISAACEWIRTIYECEDFFRSAWFEMLTGLDPEMLIRRLREDG